MNLKTYPLDERYEVSDCGRVFLKAHTVIRKNGSPMTYQRKEKALFTKEFGYQEIKASVENKTVHHRVHRMVALCFIPNPDNKPFVNHIDGNKLNNQASNLEWVTKQENQQHAEKSDLIRDRRGYAIEVFDNTGYLATFRSIQSCAKTFGLDRIVIGRVVDSDNVYKGFTFRSVSTIPRE